LEVTVVVLVEAVEELDEELVFLHPMAMITATMINTLIFFIGFSLSR